MIGKCLICGTYVRRGSVVCSSCLCSLRFNLFDTYMVRCSVCSYPLIDSVYSCPRCSVLPGVRIVSLFDYRNIRLRHLLEAFKFRGIRKYSYLFAFIIDSYLKEKGLWNSIIVPVPCSRTAFKRRGWDHMAEVAGVLGRKYGYRVCNVIRNRDSYFAEQKTMGLESRKKNAESRFMLSGEIPDRFRRVIIIDDISTTGLTLKACAVLVKEAGYKDVMALTVFAEL